MSKEQLSMMDLIIETHLDLDRQGPGSPEVTLKALSFIENLNDIAQVLDLGCGSGGQTMTLAQNISGKIIGVDQFSKFIDEIIYKLRINVSNISFILLQMKLKGLVKETSPNFYIRAIRECFE